jgi:hypothetical protein
MISRSPYTTDLRAGDERQPEKRVPSLACRVGRRTSCRRLLPSSKQRSRPARLLLVAVVGVASGRAVATTAAL